MTLVQPVLLVLVLVVVVLLLLVLVLVLLPLLFLLLLQLLPVLVRPSHRYRIAETPLRRPTSPEPRGPVREG